MTIIAEQVARHQSVAYQNDFDYTAGSPHLRHRTLNQRVIDVCRDVVREVLDRWGHCRVLEVGAGHGAFTDHVAALGAEVWITEMSQDSAILLADRFRHNNSVHVLHDSDGTAAASLGTFDVVLCLSVLHHIPDYLSTVRQYTSQIAPGGAFVSYQDPLWYPRRTRASVLVDRGAYFTWRLGRPDLTRGLASFLRRVRGAYDETKPGDMVEYHVVRDGVDERALEALLVPRFSSVRVDRYWSTQAGPLQWVGERFGPSTTFGLVATNALPHQR
ncbi:class I SAM-dependent methyltransferase [Lentzea sp. NPDC059081]|uniref:class I SAM-dependent methyltransferase n=1 Tax=Lentzea sp. NPDC059081 TaxID=3346719 RepID=UPI0036B7F84C